MTMSGSPEDVDMVLRRPVLERIPSLLLLYASSGDLIDWVGVLSVEPFPFTTRGGMAIENLRLEVVDFEDTLSFGEPPLVVEAAAVMAK
jgi:hypothetical protein